MQNFRIQVFKHITIFDETNIQKQIEISTFSSQYYELVDYQIIKIK